MGRLREGVERSLSKLRLEVEGEVMIAACRVSNGQVLDVYIYPHAVLGRGDVGTGVGDGESSGRTCSGTENADSSTGSGVGLSDLGARTNLPLDSGRSPPSLRDSRVTTAAFRFFFFFVCESPFSAGSIGGSAAARRIRQAGSEETARDANLAAEAWSRRNWTMLVLGSHPH